MFISQQYQSASHPTTTTRPAYVPAQVPSLSSTFSSSSPTVSFSSSSSYRLALAKSHRHQSKALLPTSSSARHNYVTSPSLLPTPPFPLPIAQQSFNGYATTKPAIVFQGDGNGSGGRTSNLAMPITTAFGRIPKLNQISNKNKPKKNTVANNSVLDFLLPEDFGKDEAAGKSATTTKDGGSALLLSDLVKPKFRSVNCLVNSSSSQSAVSSVSTSSSISSGMLLKFPFKKPAINPAATISSSSTISSIFDSPEDTCGDNNTTITTKKFASSNGLSCQNVTVPSSKSNFTTTLSVISSKSRSSAQQPKHSTTLTLEKTSDRRVTMKTMTSVTTSQAMRPPPPTFHLRLSETGPSKIDLVGQSHASLNQSTITTNLQNHQQQQQRWSHSYRVCLCLKIVSFTSLSPETFLIRVHVFECIPSLVSLSIFVST